MSGNTPPTAATRQKVSAGGGASPPSPFRRGAGGEVFSRGPSMTTRARALRNTMTEAERRLWAGLRGDRLGVRFRRQLAIDGRYIADFCAPSLSLIIEVDGSQHAEPWADEIRTSYLEKRGYRIMRFWNNDVLNATDAVLEAILASIRDLTAANPSPPAPLPGERGAPGRAVSGGASTSALVASVAFAPPEFPKDIH